MPFLFGPVVPVELVTTARRRRHFVVRVLFALAFLLALWSSYTAFFESSTRSTTDIADLAEFAREFFNIFVIVQLSAVLLLTPAYVAPCLADEKERRTLDYLLTTDLRNREIVFGKLLVRVGHLVLYVAAAAPILYMATWFGGISFELLTQAYALSLITIAGVACGSMFFSVHARRVREAVAGTYAAVMLLLVMPPMFEGLLFTPSMGRPALLQDSVLHRFNRVLLHCDPMWVWTQEMPGIPAAGGWETIAYYAMYVGLFAAPALLWCVLRARATYLRQAYGAAKPPKVRASRSRRSRRSKGTRLFSRCSLEEHPVGWKEIYTGTQRFRWVNIVALVLGIAFVAWCGWYIVRLSLPELGRGSLAYLTYSMEYRDWIRADMNQFIRAAGTMLTMLLLLVAAVQSATSIATERERQTWDALIATNLEPREIIWGKLAGTLHAIRWLTALILAGWIVGVLAGALHPLAIFVLCAELAVYTLFVIGRGLRFSLSMRRSGGALAAVLGISFFCGGGYLMCCAPVMISADGGMFFLGAAFPFVLGCSAFRGEELHDFLTGNTYPEGELVGFAFGTAIMLSVYLGAGLSLVAACITDFDRLTGRTTPDSRAGILQANPEVVNGPA